MAGLRQQVLHQPARGLLVVGAAALDERDGARNDGALTRGDSAGEPSQVRRYRSGGHKFAPERTTPGWPRCPPGPRHEMQFAIDFNDIYPAQDESFPLVNDR